MPNRTKSVHKNMPTFGQKRPAVRLCGGGKNRPDAADEKPARQRPLCADVRHPAIFGIFSPIRLLYKRLHGYICTGQLNGGSSWRGNMRTPILYFAYGSNMHPARMARRCPGAITVGVGILRNHRLTERLYADIDFQEGREVRGVLYLITEAHLRSLDAHEGYPKVYRRMWLDVEFDGVVYQAVTYEMTAETKAARDGRPYPEEYRMLCSEGARIHHVKNGFTKRRKACK